VQTSHRLCQQFDGLDRRLIAPDMNPIAHCRRLPIVVLLCCSSASRAQQPELVSVNSSGIQADFYSEGVTISADGRFAAFTTAATNLAPNDTNTFTDVYLRDTLTGLTTLVSADSAGQVSDSGGIYPSISADGRRVAFVSRATNLDAGAPPFAYSAYVHDMQTGTTTLVSRDESGSPMRQSSLPVQISGDGRHVLFHNGLGPPGTVFARGAWYVRDLQSQTTTRVAPGGAFQTASYEDGQILQDGRWVGFSRLMPPSQAVPFTSSRILLIDRDSDQNGIFDEPGTFRRILIEPTGGAPYVRLVSSSRNGRFLLYMAAADANSKGELWLHDRDPDGDGTFDQPNSAQDQFVSDRFVPYLQFVQPFDITDDGHLVCFLGPTSTLLTGATALWVRDMRLRGPFLQSIDVATGGAARIVDAPSITRDGAFTFASSSGPLVTSDVNLVPDVYRIPYVQTHCPDPAPYGKAAPNSVYRLGAEMHVVGSVGISDDDFSLLARFVPNGPGQFFYGPEQVELPFGDGFRLVGAGGRGLFRLPVLQAAGNVATYQMHFGSPPANTGLGRITPGSIWNFQYVFRDPASGGHGINTSSAVQVQFCE
jgi:hypothetical protein